VKENESSLSLLLIGVDPAISDFILAVTPGVKTTHVRTTEEFLALLESPELSRCDLLVAGPGLAEITVGEVAQSLRGGLRQAPIFYVHHNRDFGFDGKSFRKNGFTDVFLYPFEKDLLKARLEEALAKIKFLPVFRSVRVQDIEPDQVLDFDLHVLLPLNGRYVRYSAAGQSVDASRVAKLKNTAVGSFFVPVHQMEKFHAYTSGRLHRQSEGSGVPSETEKRERLQAAIRDLLSEIFSTNQESGFSDGKKLLEEIQKTIHSLVLPVVPGEFRQRLLQVVGDTGGNYAHLANVSLFAALFSVVTGVGTPEDLALAGMFHDIGLAVVPLEDQDNPQSAAYQRHPELSLNLLKEKRIPLSEKIQLPLLQHHERANGTGFPSGLAEPKLKNESQILGLADEFDELTRVQEGRAPLSSEEALRVLWERGEFSRALVERLIAALHPESPEGVLGTPSALTRRI